MGYVEETGAAQYLRDARITTIYEGTTGIQANDLLSRKLVRDKGLNAAALIRDMTAELDALAPTNDADLSAIASAYKAALGVFEQQSKSLAAACRSPPRSILGQGQELPHIGSFGWPKSSRASVARSGKPSGRIAGDARPIVLQPWVFEAPP
jgi:3-(methylsulfanyl)propanoyl-CoA dehydrogenase